MQGEGRVGMTDIDDDSAFARRVFSGIVPTRTDGGEAATHDHLPFRSTRLGKGVMATVPIVLAGAMTVSMNLTGPLEPAAAAAKRPVKAKVELRKSMREIVSAAVASPATKIASVKVAAAAPTSYTVAAGDTVSSIAGRYGLSTASVLAVNGLSWKSLIFPGQVLKLSSPAATSPTAAPAPAVTPGGRYTIVAGDTIGAIAARYGVTTDAVLGANGLTRSSIIYPGQTIAIPAGATPGIQAPSIQTVAAVTPIAPPVAPAAGTSYTIKSGDTISAIAGRFGTTSSALLAANGLTASSMIYAGRTLTIPGAAGVTPAANPATGMTAEMAANARTIIQVGRRLDVPDRGIVIALAAAAQESGLLDLGSGDRDSVGVFQQRPSTGWGTRDELMDVGYAAQLFYGGPNNPNAGITRGLLDIPGWQSMSVTQAAQAVQISAFPDAYAKWESSATGWLTQYR
jgi:LysM repeat protein